MEGAHVIEVNDLISMRSQPNYGCSCARNEKSIAFPLLQKIGRMPCDVNNDVYEPSVVSIGPYHHNSQAILGTERTKWDSLRYILELNPERKMKDYLETMASLEKQIRSCYGDKIEVDSDKFLKMMLLDGCFILCLLYGTEGVVLEPTAKLDMPNIDVRNSRMEPNFLESPISNKFDARQQASSSNTDHDSCIDNAYYSKQWYTSFSTFDLLLLENQIPFFIIKKIYELVTGGHSPISVLLENIAMFMEDLLHPYTKTIPKFHPPEEVHHLLHLCHLYFKPNQTQVNSNPNLVTSQLYQLHHCDEEHSVFVGQQLYYWHRASEYRKSGIEFKTREICVENPHTLLDIGFCEGVMEIPSLTIDPNTHCLFRNLLAFEETCLHSANYITAYVIFLSQFIGMPEDVSLLTKTGIIVHQLDDDSEVSSLFKMLAEGVTFDINSDHYLKHVHHDMEVHYQMQRPKWREWLGLIGSKLPGWPHES